MKGVSRIIAAIIVVLIALLLISLAWLFIFGIVGSRTSKVISCEYCNVIRGHTEILIRNDGTQKILLSNLSSIPFDQIKNLAPNPNFEEDVDSNNIPDGWEIPKKISDIVLVTDLSDSMQRCMDNNSDFTECPADAEGKPSNCKYKISCSMNCGEWIGGKEERYCVNLTRYFKTTYKEMVEPNWNNCTYVIGVNCSGDYPNEPPITNYSTDSNGYIADWLILGSFSEDHCACESGTECKSFINETSEAPYNGLTESGHTWFEWHGLTTTSCGIGIDLDNQVIEPGTDNNNVVAYAFAYIYSPIKRNAQLRVGSDDGIEVWLNGKIVDYNPHACRCWAPDQDIVSVNLTKGWNRLLVRIGENWGWWGFIVRFTDMDGNPLTDLKIALNKPFNVSCESGEALLSSCNSEYPYFYEKKFNNCSYESACSESVC